MRISFLVICSIFCFTDMAAAGECCYDPPVPKRKIHYSQGYKRLAAMFDEGKSFDFAASEGWYSGRCWSWNSETAQNGLLVMEQRQTDGPEFPAVKKFSLYQQEGQPANFFEKYSSEEKEASSHKRLNKNQSMHHQWRKNVARNFTNDWDDISLIADAEGGGFTNTYARLAPMIVRKSSDDKYFVLKNSDTLLCYFFEPVEAARDQNH